MNTTTEITREIATKVRDIIAMGLSKGLGEKDANGFGIPGKICVEAAVCCAFGLPHGDDPGCVSQAVRALKIALNDKDWSSNEARARGLRRLALAQLGSAGVVDDREFARRVVEVTIRGAVPRALRAAASIQQDAKHRQALIDAAIRCEGDGTRAYAAAATAAYAAARAASANAAASAAYAAYAADGAYAADAAAYAADAAAYAADAAAATRDKELARFAEEVVQVLVAINAPGCQWLDLVPLAEAA